MSDAAKPYENEEEMLKDVWFGGQRERVQATIAKRVEEAKNEQSAAMRKAAREGTHFFPWGEPDCIFCGCFGPTEADESCLKLQDLFEANRELVEVRKTLSPIGVEKGHTVGLIQFLQGRVKDLETLLNNIDFHIDEWAVGICRIEPKLEGPERWEAEKKLPGVVEDIFTELLKAKAEIYNLKKDKK